MRQTSWIEDVRGWPAPRPADDGISLVVEALAQLAGARGRVAAEIGPEMRVQMPIADLLRIRDARGRDFVDAGPVLRPVRMVKSALEVARMREIAGLASEAFARLGPAAPAGAHRAGGGARSSRPPGRARRRHRPLPDPGVRPARLRADQHGPHRPAARGGRPPHHRRGRHLARLLLRFRPELRARPCGRRDARRLCAGLRGDRSGARRGQARADGRRGLGRDGGRRGSRRPARHARRPDGPRAGPRSHRGAIARAGGRDRARARHGHHPRAEPHLAGRSVGWRAGSWCTRRTSS